MNGSPKEITLFMPVLVLWSIYIIFENGVGFLKNRKEEMDKQKSSLEDKALLSVKEMCTYLSIGQTKCRELLADPANGFTVRIGNRLYAHKKHLDKWLENQIY